MLKVKDWINKKNSEQFEVVVRTGKTGDNIVS